MSELMEITEKFINDLKQERDHLRVQMALAKAEAKEQWAVLEKKWEKFSREAEVFADVAKDTAKEAGDDLSVLGSDIKDGYKRLRDSL